jgi:hypothetical protein
MVPRPWHHEKCGGHCTPAVAAVVAILLLLATVEAISLQLATVAPLSIFNCSPVNDDAVEAKMTASCFIYPPPSSRCFFSLVKFPNDISTTWSGNICHLHVLET